MKTTVVSSESLKFKKINHRSLKVYKDYGGFFG